MKSFSCSVTTTVVTASRILKTKNIPGIDSLRVIVAVIVTLGVILLSLVAARPSPACPSTPSPPLVLLIDGRLRPRPRVADCQAAAVAAVAPAAVPRRGAVPVGHLPGGRRRRRRRSRRLGRALDLVEVANGGTIAGRPSDDQTDLVVLLQRKYS